MPSTHSTSQNNVPQKDIRTKTEDGRKKIDNPYLYKNGKIKKAFDYVVTIPGMDDALAISSDDNPKMSSLTMRRILNSPLKCKGEPMLESAQTINDRVYTEKQIDIFGPLLDVETLQKMFIPE